MSSSAHSPWCLLCTITPKYPIRTDRLSNHLRASIETGSLAMFANTADADVHHQLGCCVVVVVVDSSSRCCNNNTSILRARATDDPSILRTSV